MTDITVIYFHGYGSNPNTDKVKMLKENFDTVLAFPIDPDPDVSFPFLEKKIDDYLLSNINSQNELVFVGTSLGAWYAGHMACLFGAKCVLINPCYSLDALKIDLGIPENIKAKYDKIGFAYPTYTQFYMSLNDEVIDFNTFPMKYNPSWINWYNTADHRFNGPEFQEVIKYLKTI